jgi:hypothetical protein
MDPAPHQGRWKAPGAGREPGILLVPKQGLTPKLLRGQPSPHIPLGCSTVPPPSSGPHEVEVGLTQLPSHSGLGAEEPLSSMTDDTGSPLSTGYNTRSGSEEIVTDAGDLDTGAALHGSQELLAHARTRMRTASELLLDRWQGRGCVFSLSLWGGVWGRGGAGLQSPGLRAEPATSVAAWALELRGRPHCFLQPRVAPLQAPVHPRAGGG